MNLNQVLLSTFVSDISKSLHEVESIYDDVDYLAGSSENTRLCAKL